MLSNPLSRCLTLAVAAVFIGTCAAQVMQDPGTMPDGRRVHFPPTGPSKSNPDAPARTPQIQTGSAAAAPAPVAGLPAHTQAAAAPSLLDKPPAPASVTLSSGELAVKANNSSLSQILGQLASSSGMTIDGLNQDQRVFGSYGPGNPRDVLTSLLDGAGYNVLMVGETQKGAPRELILTARSEAPPTTQAAGAPPAPDSDDEDDSSNVYQQPERLNPTLPAMPPDVPQGGVKSPAQILQELQQIRQQQQAQQPPQPQ